MATIFDAIRQEQGNQAEKLGKETPQIRKDNTSPLPDDLNPIPQQQEPSNQTELKSKPTIFDSIKNEENKIAEPSILPKKQEEKFDYEGENDLDREIERNIARGISLIPSTLGGIPGDLQEFGRNLFGIDNKKFSPLHFLPSFPTSKELEEGVQKASLGYLTPKNDFEKKSDELLKDIYSISAGGTPSLARNIGIPIASNLIKEGVKYGTKDEELGSIAKVGSMVLFDLLNWRQTLGHGGARRYASHLFQESERHIPNGATTDARLLHRELNVLLNNLLSGGTSPSKSNSITKINEMIGAIQNGRISVRRLVDFRKTINELISSKGGFEFSQLPNVVERAVHNLNTVKRRVISTLDDYGHTNPQFGVMNRAANEAYAAYSASNTLSNFFRSHADKIQNKALRTSLGLASTAIGGTSLAFLPGATTLAAGAGTAVTPVYYAAKIAQRMYRSPTLRRYYNAMFREVLEGNTTQAVKTLNKLENKVSEEEDVKQKKIKKLGEEAKGQQVQRKNRKELH